VIGRVATPGLEGRQVAVLRPHATFVLRDGYTILPRRARRITLVSLNYSRNVLGREG
jgi:hypothetical protein